MFNDCRSSQLWCRRGATVAARHLGLPFAVLPGCCIAVTHRTSGYCCFRRSRDGTGSSVTFGRVEVPVVPFAYDAPQIGPLRQGEIIGPVWLHRADAPAKALGQDTPVPLISSAHARMVVLHAECDLEQDFTQRDTNNGRPTQQAVDSRLLPEVLLCDVFQATEIRDRTPPGSTDFRRVQQNQNERFHRLPQAAVADTGSSLPELFLDFKCTYMEPPSSLYVAILSGDIRRLAIVPSLYLQDLMHRFFGFQSRIGLPE